MSSAFVEKTSLHFLKEPSDWRAETLAYGTALLVVVAAFVAVAVLAGGRGPAPAVSEIDGAVLVDLSPADLSASPGAVQDGPARQAVSATLSSTTPEIVRRFDPIDDSHKAPDPTSSRPPSPSPATPAVAPEEERAPVGSNVPRPSEPDDGEVSVPRASSRAITAWQKSLMRRLEVAKRAVVRAAHATGTVRIAFAIDRSGIIRSERIVESSGSNALDAAASDLVRRASPFPAPPAGARGDEMSFVVPIRFMRTGRGG